MADLEMSRFLFKEGSRLFDAGQLLTVERIPGRRLLGLHLPQRPAGDRIVSDDRDGAEDDQTEYQDHFGHVYPREWFKPSSVKGCLSVFRTLPCCLPAADAR